MSQQAISFRPENDKQREDFELLCFVLDQSPSETIRTAINDLITRHQAEMDKVKPLYEAAQGALAQARASLQGVDNA